MILINLLPHREAARKRRKEIFYATLGLAVGAGLLISALVYGWYQAQIASQNDKNQFLQTEIKKLEEEIKQVSTLEAEIAALRARQQAVEDLQGDRNLPVHLVTEMAKQLPDGVYIASFKQEGTSIQLTGVAQSQERVSELLRNLANNSPWLTRPELIEIVAANLALSPRDNRRVFNFNMKVQIRKPTDVQRAATAQPAASGASAPATTSTAAKS
jgi:type IV pilus assembly protein PilN